MTASESAGKGIAHLVATSDGDDLFGLPAVREWWRVRRLDSGTWVSPTLGEGCPVCVLRETHWHRLDPVDPSRFAVVVQIREDPL